MDVQTNAFFKQYLHLFPQYIPPSGMGRLSQCCKELNAFVNAVAAPYWIWHMPDIKVFNRDIIVKWPMMARDAKLAKTTYLAIKFFLNYVHFAKTQLKTFNELPSIFPAPLLCSWLYNMDTSIFIESLSTIWKVIPESDRQVFVERMAVPCATNAFSDFYVRNGRVYADFVNHGLCKVLLEKGQNISDLITIFFHKFYTYNELSAIDELLKLAKQHLSRTEELNNLLTGAIEYGCDTAILQRLIDMGAKLSEIPLLLHIVLAKCPPDKLVEVTRFLVKAGALITALDAHERTPLRNFMLYNKLTKDNAFVLQLLAENGDLETLKNGFLEVMKHCGSYEVLQIFQKLKACSLKPDALGRTLLHHCKWDPVLFRYLLSEGVDPNAVNDAGNTALKVEIGLSKDGEEILSMLKLFNEFKVDFSKDPFLLHVLCRRKIPNKAKPVKFLLEQGLKATAKNNDGELPIQLETYQYDNLLNEDVIESLLDAGETLSVINDVNVRFYLACRLGKIKDIMNWQEDLPVQVYIYINNHYISPIVAAIEKGHIHVVKYLLEKRGNDCFPPRKDATPPLTVAINIADMTLRREMVRLIAPFSKDLSDYTMLTKLISMGDIDLFQEILDGMDKNFRREYVISESCYIVDNALLMSIKGCPEVLEKVNKILPKSAWKSNNPLIAHAPHSNAMTMIPELYKRNPKSLFYGKSSDLLECICSRLATEPKMQAHYLELFRLVKGWIAEQSPKVSKIQQAKAIKSFFQSIHQRCLFDLPFENRKEIFDFLLTKSAFKIRDDMDENPLGNIYQLFFSTCQPMKHWEEIKARLELLELNFGEREKDIETPLHNLEVTYKQIENSMKGSEDPSEYIEVLRDMIKFAWKHNVQEGIYHHIKETSPLHGVVSTDKWDCKNQMERKRGEAISLALTDELITLGHPIDVEDHDGNTPLHIAVTGNNTPVILRLLEGGARYDIINKTHKTAENLANEYLNLKALAKMRGYHMLLNGNFG